MAVKPNATNEGSSTRLFTGVAQFKVVAINPSQEELKALGYKADKAPNYYDEKNAAHRVVFFLEGKAGNETIKTNRAFFMKNKLRTDMFINKFGKFGKDRSKLGETARNPFEGEIDLINFIADWCNVKKDQENSLDSIEQIVKTGDVFELRDILSGAKENTFQALATVRDGKYQSIYEKVTLRSWSTDLAYLHKSLAENEQYIKAEIGPIDLKLFVPAQFTLREFKPTAALATAPVSSNGQETHQSGTPEAGADTPAAGTDDSPF